MDRFVFGTCSSLVSVVCLERNKLNCQSQVYIKHSHNTHEIPQCQRSSPKPSSAEPKRFGNKFNHKRGTGRRILVFGTASIKGFVKSGDFC